MTKYTITHDGDTLKSGLTAREAVLYAAKWDGWGAEFKRDGDGVMALRQSVNRIGNNPWSASGDETGLYGFYSTNADDDAAIDECVSKLILKIEQLHNLMSVDVECTEKCHVFAMPTDEAGFGPNIDLGFTSSLDEAKKICADAGYEVLGEGVEHQTYDAEDAPSIFGYKDDGFGAIAIAVKAESEKISAEYIGGRFTSMPEDHFYQDDVDFEVIGDDGEFTFFSFLDGSRVKVDSDGNIFDGDTQDD